MGIRLWVKEKVAKLRHRRHDDNDNNNSNNQLQATESQDKRGCSVLFARARQHRNQQKAMRREKARSRSNPETISHSNHDSDDAGGQWKPCVVCEKKFQSTTSKYLDYCSTDCKTKAFMERKSQGDMPSRASEWI